MNNKTISFAFYLKYQRMKTLFFSAFILFTLNIQAQQKTEVVLASYNEPMVFTKRVVLNEFAGSSVGWFTISGTSTATDLSAIEKASIRMGMPIVFANQKFERNRLTYCELLFSSEGKQQVLTFGSDDLKLLPLKLLLKQQKEKEEPVKMLLIKDNKNDRNSESSEKIYYVS